MENKAALFLPKEELASLDVHINNVIDAWATPDKRLAHSTLWKKLFRAVSFTPFFGPDWWQEEDFMNELDLSGTAVESEID